MPKKKPSNLHADRYEQLAEAFLRYLERYLPGFKKEPPEARRALCRMIFEAPTRYRAHSHYEGYARFHYKELEERFGRSQFNRINAALGLFDVPQDWSKVEGRTKPYMLAEKVTTLRERFLAGCHRRSTRLMTEDGKILQAPPASAIASKNKDGQTRRGFKDLPVTTLVPVNLVRLKKLMEDIQARLYAQEAGIMQGEIFSALPSKQFLRSLHQEAAMLVSKARNQNWPGYVLHRYTESEIGGRYYADGVANLQNCYRAVREAAMAGLYDIDIENCHYSILAQMAAQCGYQCTEVLRYLADKEGVRVGLMREFGISKQQAKSALIALIYGARFSHRAKDALPKIFGGDIKLAAQVYNHPQFRALRDDIGGARRAVLAAQPVTRRTMKNCRGLTISLDESDDRQQLAHLLQGVEVAALEAAYRQYPKEIVLLQHDGFTATRTLDTARIEAAMFESTGYRLKVEQKVIQINLGQAFDDHPADLKNQIEIDRKPNAGAGFHQSIAS